MMPRCTTSVFFLAAAAVGLSGLIYLSTAWADDDKIVAVVAAVTPDVQEINVNFDAWIFPGAQTAEAGRQRLSTQVNLQVQEVKRICNLSAEQEEQLRLAGQGDMGRFLNEVEKLRRKFTAEKHDREAINQMWQQVQPLQARQARGITGPDSLLGKTVATTLTPEQTVEYDKAMGDRRRFRYQAAVGVGLHALESSVALKHEQREALMKMLLELPPPRVFGQYDQQLVSYRLATLPPAKLKPLFDDRQWQALQQPLNQGRAMQGHLQQQGYIDRDEAAGRPEAKTNE